MITGAHFLLYSKDSDADRAFFRDVLGFRSVDLGHGWLIFGLPPAELAAHPDDTGGECRIDVEALHHVVHEPGLTKHALAIAKVVHVALRCWIISCSRFF